MPEMGITTATSHLGADHTMTSVLNLDEVCSIEGFEEARPAAARFELRIGLEKREITADATKHTDAFFVE